MIGTIPKIKRQTTNKIEIMDNYSRLLTEYINLKDEILYFTEEHHDSMAFDIDGFNTVGEDDKLSFLPELEQQVKAFRLILKGSKKIAYTFA